MKNMKIGITTTVPVEIIFASGNIPCDLNNVFITSEHKEKYLRDAEIAGFPRNLCCWIKGIFGAVKSEQLDEIVAVMQGDCSNTHALAEIWESTGKRIIPFSYPYDSDHIKLKREIQTFAEYFGITNVNEIEEMRHELNIVRELAHNIDYKTWAENTVSGFENHFYLVSTSDFEGDFQSYRRKMDNFLYEICHRQSNDSAIRLAYIGVPPVFSDIYDTIEQYGARIVFNEIQRQFAMPNAGNSIVEQYLNYTYPYPVSHRIADIREQIKLRNIHGIIHYVEPFCFRQIQDILFRNAFAVPYMVIEGNESFQLDARSKLRLSAFIEMIKKGR